MPGITPQRFQRLSAALCRRQPDLTVLLDGVHKAFNLSAIIRTCDAAGLFEAHSTSEHKPEELSQHHAQGSQQWVYWHDHPNTEVACKRLRQRGFLLVGADLTDDSVDFRSLDFTRPTAFVMGAEKFGLTDEARRNLDRTVTIPMYGLVGSLNVGVATALLLYEAQRQREEAGYYENCRLAPAEFQTTLFEWCYPLVSQYCRDRDLAYPEMGPQGQLEGNIHGRSLTAIRRLIRQEQNTLRRGP